MPPLRDRKEDVETLARHFIKKFSGDLGKNVVGFTPEALETLRNQQWRGNVRELENTVQRAVLLCREDLIDVSNFMFHEDAPSQATDPRGFQGSLKDMEREMILRTLREVDGNKSRAAKMLGVSVRTKRNKLGEYGENIS